jgi:Ca2+/Na+ antiporter
MTSIIAAVITVIIGVSAILSGETDININSVDGILGVIFFVLCIVAGIIMFIAMVVSNIV